MRCSHFLMKLKKHRLFCFLHTLAYHTTTLFQVHGRAHSTRNLNDKNAGKSHSRYEFVKQKFAENFAAELSRAKDPMVRSPKLSKSHSESSPKICQQKFAATTTTTTKQPCKQPVNTACQSSTAPRNFNSKKCSMSAVVGGSSYVLKSSTSKAGFSCHGSTRSQKCFDFDKDEIKTFV